MTANSTDPAVSVMNMPAEAIDVTDCSLADLLTLQKDTTQNEKDRWLAAGCCPVPAQAQVYIGS